MEPLRQRFLLQKIRQKSGGNVWFRHRHLQFRSFCRRKLCTCPPGSRCWVSNITNTQFGQKQPLSPLDQGTVTHSLRSTLIGTVSGLFGIPRWRASYQTHYNRSVIPIRHCFSKFSGFIARVLRTIFEQLRVLPKRSGQKCIIIVLTILWFA